MDRLGDYQRLLKEMIKYSGRAGLETGTLERALQLLIAIPQRADDLSFIRAIRGYPGQQMERGGFY